MSLEGRPAGRAQDAERVRLLLERAMALHRSGDRAAAATLYRDVIELDAGNFDALHLLGVVIAQGGDPAAGVSLMDRAIRINPTDAAVHCNRGVALHALKQLDAALGSFDAAIALQRDYADAFTFRGVVLRELRRFDAALASYDTAIAIAPASAVAHVNRGNLLREQGQAAAAVASYERALALRPGYAEAYLYRGDALRELECSEAALQSFERAITLRPDYAEAHLRRGNLLRDLLRPQAALASYDTALALKADYAEAYLNRGTVLREMMQLEAALGSYDQAIALRPDFAEAYANRGTVRLLLGDYANGWPDYEWRPSNRASDSDREANRAQRRWLGNEALEGKTIVLSGEQGFGDTLQFCRYAGVVSEFGARVLLEVQAPLVSLLVGLEGASEVLAIGTELPNADLHCPLPSLPLALKTRPDTIPGAQGYLRADSGKVAQWRSRLGERIRPRVGLAWSGNPRHSHDRHRSIALQALLAGLPEGLQYVSLQRELRDADAQTLGARPDVLDLGSSLHDFSDTAALCQCLDLVISVDSAVAHLSGALGQITWILLPFHPDWRWLTGRSDSPWYHSVTLFRQTRPGAWDEVLARVSAELVNRLGAGSAGL